MGNPLLMMLLRILDWLAAPFARRTRAEARRRAWTEPTEPLCEIVAAGSPTIWPRWIIRGPGSFTFDNDAARFDVKAVPIDSDFAEDDPRAVIRCCICSKPSIAATCDACEAILR